MESSKDSGAVAKYIWLIGSPIVFTLGLVGNLLTIIIYVRQKMTSSTIYLTFLAVCDLLTLCSILPRWWIIYLVGLDIRHLNDYVCKFSIFVSAVAGRASNWCLVFITMERLICIVRARPIYTLCTPKLAMSLLTSMTISIGLFFSYDFYGFQVIEMKKGQVVQSTERGQNDIVTLAMNPIFNFSDTNHSYSSMTELSSVSMYSSGANSSTVSPFGEWHLMSTSATVSTASPITTIQPFVTVKACLQRQDESNYIAFTNVMEQITLFGWVLGANLCLLIGTIVIVRKLSMVKATLKAAASKGSSASNSDVSKIRKRTSQTTITVLVVNVFLFVCQTPLLTFYIFRTTFIDAEKGMTTTQNLIWAILFIMYSINYAVNFYLYILMGSKIRQECKILFRCGNPGLYKTKNESTM